MHPSVARLLACVLALGAFVALLGAHGLIAAALGALAWFALPDEELQKRPDLLGHRLGGDPELLEHLRPRR
jgi:hypothetical protein